jgi:hypothetical protein
VSITGRRVRPRAGRDNQRAAAAQIGPKSVTPPTRWRRASPGCYGVSFVDLPPEHLEPINEVVAADEHCERRQGRAIR